VWGLGGEGMFGLCDGGGSWAMGWLGGSFGGYFHGGVRVRGGWRGSGGPSCV